MKGLTAVLLCLLGITTGADIIFKKDDFAKTPPDFIQIPTKDRQTLFKTLDKNCDGKLDSSDMSLLFTNPRAAEDGTKFLEEADIKDSNKEVDHDEFELFMSELSAVWAVAGCKFVKETAQTLKLKCYLDEFMAYVHALMPFGEVKELFKELDKNENGEITAEELESQLKIEGRNTNDEDVHDVVSNLLKEWGRNDKKASFPDFKSYVRQVEVYMEMKPCQHKASCSKNILIKYSTYTLTEFDIHSLFLALDKNHDGKLTEDDLTQYTMNPKAFLSLVDLSDDDTTVDFEEFRMFMKRVLIKNVLQEYCAKIYNRVKEQECYIDHLFGILRFAYRYAKLTIPHADVFYAFDELDKDKSGGIGDEELAQYEPNAELRKRILSELDTTSKDKNINLDEFSYFITYPCTIYALSGCLYEATEKKNECYAKTFVDFTSHMMTGKEIAEFFRVYDPENTQKISRDYVGTVIPVGETHDEDVENFMKELGLGDEEVTLFEFVSYVRHPDLVKLIESCKTMAEKQAALLEYIQKYLTEYDIEQVFEKFDTNKDLEIDLSDLKNLGKSEEQCKQLLKAMDSLDEGTNVDFREFRHYLLLPENKQLLEKDCTAPLTKQIEEMKCYQEKIWAMVTK